MTQSGLRQRRCANMVRLVVLAGLLSACAGEKLPADNTSLEALTATQEQTAEITALNAQLLSRGRTSGNPGDYLLGPGDLVQISVFEAAELKTEARVSSRGLITLPLLGPVEVKNLSAAEAEARIEDLYRQKYIKNPHVSVFVKEHLSHRITLVGQLKSPGTYDLIAKMRLVDVLALAGGLTDKAGRMVHIRRVAGDADDRGAFVVDLDTLIREGKTELNIEINGGDVIYVPEAGSYFVDGAVRKPGSYPIRQETDLQQALVAAGGLAPWANKEKVTLVRYQKAGDRQVLTLELNNPDVLELRVQDRDAIIAQSSTWGKLTHGMGIRIGLPFFGIGYRDPESD